MKLALGTGLLLLLLGAIALTARSGDTPKRPDVPARLATDAELVYLQVSAGYPAVMNVWWSPAMDDLAPDRIVRVDTAQAALRKATFTCTSYSPAGGLFSCFPFPGTRDGEEGMFYLTARDMDALFQTRRAYGILPNDIFPQANN